VPIYVCNPAGTGWGEDTTDPANFPGSGFLEIPVPGGCGGKCGGHAKPCPVTAAIMRGWPAGDVFELIAHLHTAKVG